MGAGRGKTRRVLLNHGAVRNRPLIARTQDLEVWAVHSYVQEAVRAAGYETQEEFWGETVRGAVDDVLNGAVTGRWRVDELSNVEKTHIGTAVENRVRDVLGFRRGDNGQLDYLVEGVEVDMKWSKNSGWMIPKEQVGKIAVVVGLKNKGEDNDTLQVGIVRCRPAWLTKGSNRDGKKTLTKKGKEKIQWLVLGEPLPDSFISQIPPHDLEEILAQPPGEARVRKLFELQHGKPIPRRAIETVAQHLDRHPPVAQREVAPGTRVFSYEELRGHLAELGISMKPGEWVELARNEVPDQVRQALKF